MTSPAAEPPAAAEPPDAGVPRPAGESLVAGELTAPGESPDAGPRRPVVAILPAKDEAQRIGATIDAVHALLEVDLVLVVDDGSTDGTSAVAAQHGATVRRHETNQGKAAAMTTGAEVAARVTEGEHLLLFVDADLEGSAAALGVLVGPVARDEADMTVAVLPPQRTSGGGHGFVVRLARDGILARTGWVPAQPLSGMRCLSSTAYEAARPLARGWGVEVGLTVDVLRAGLRVVEVPCELHHRVTGSDWRGQLHRAAQYRDVWWALRRRR